MQVQKEEIRRRIIDSALDEFSVHGYKKVTMKDIALKAGITPGNIYSYFRSKDALLKCLLEDAITILKEAIAGTIPSGNLPCETNIDEYSRSLAKKYMQIRKPILILLNGCEGSKYEDFKFSLEELACQRIITEFPDRFSEIKSNRNVAEAVAAAMIHGISHIFIQCNHDFELFSSTLSEYMKFMIGNLFAEN